MSANHVILFSSKNITADLNRDSKVNYMDLYILARHYGQKDP